VDEREAAVLEHLRVHGASFFGPLHKAAGGGYPAETVRALWTLVWQGTVTNDTFHALRAFTTPRRRSTHRPPGPAFRSRRFAIPSSEGRWSLVPRLETATTTAWAAATARQLLARHGVVTREVVVSEQIAGGFSTIYPVLKTMEDGGQVRRGYFVAGLGAAQFAQPGAVDLLRSLRDTPDDLEIAALAAADPANPYGATLKWPRPGGSDGTRRPTRAVGPLVILVNGALAAYVARAGSQLLTWLPEAEPERSRAARAVARVLIDRARAGDEAPRGMLVEEIDDVRATAHALTPFLAEAGFVAGALGMQATFPKAATGIHTGSQV
jgi:ATP-dependent Lhr-like helicase